MPQTVYLETSVISLLAARPSRDLIVAARQLITEDFWARHRPRYDMRISAFVLDELRRGDSRAAERRLALVDGVAELAVDDRARELLERLLKARALPPKAWVDGAHVAVATVHAVDFLLTWNLKHIAHANVRRKIDVVCRAAGYEPPVLCTPDELTGEFSP